MTKAKMDPEQALKALVNSTIVGVPDRDLIRLNTAARTMNVGQLKEWGRGKPWFAKVEPLLEMATSDGKLLDPIVEAIQDRVLEKSEK